MKDEEKRCENCIHNEEHLKAIQEGKQGSAICMLECNPSHICFEPIIKMTDEEMAEEYKKALKQRLIDEDNFERLEMFDENVEEAFLAGLKARPQWHDLRKDPNDLPPKMVSNHNFSIEVLSDRGEIVCYNFHYCEWFYWRRGRPFAWCEIPTFDKE